MTSGQGHKKTDSYGNDGQLWRQTVMKKAGDCLLSECGTTNKTLQISRSIHLDKFT